MTLVSRIARPMMASVFVAAAADVVRKPGPRAAVAAPTIEKISNAVPILPEDPETVVRINAGVQLVGALCLATGRFPRVAALVLAGSLAPTTLAGHAFWKVEPEHKATQRVQFFKNLAIIGGLLSLAADHGGRPSVAWRLSHLSKPNFLPD